jgi:hypothetical protein
LATRQTPPARGPSRKEKWQRKPFFPGSPIKKSAVLIGAILAVVILIAAVFFITAPSGSPGFNLTIPGTSSVIPGIGAGGIPPGPTATTATGSETPASGAMPEDTSMPEVTTARPALTIAPGDPGTILSQYPSLFNAEDGNGIWAMLATDIRSQYSLDDLNNDLDVARSIGNSIDSIRITNQIIDGDHATLIVDVAWKTADTPVTGTQNLVLVREDNQWKLDTLILHP